MHFKMVNFMVGEQYLDFQNSRYASGVGKLSTQNQCQYSRYCESCTVPAVFVFFFFSIF